MDKNIIPKISVLMPVFNCRQYIEESVNSIINQTFTDFEFLIIDDCSTDGTFEYLQSLSDPRINLIRKTQNSGHTISLNMGLELAKGEYIARMDGDDVSLPERLTKQVDFLETHPEIGVLGTRVQIMDAFGNISHTLQFPTQHGVLRWSLCFYNPIVHPSVIMRREIIERAGGYNPDMKHAEDYDLWRRLSGLTRLSNLQDVLFCLRKHDANVSILNPPEERRFSVQVSRQMISHILNEDVPAVTVQCLWDSRSQSAYYARHVAELVYRLYQSIVSDVELPVLEKHAIRRDAAGRMYVLSRSWVKDISVWGVLVRACYLDPLLVLRIAKQRLLRLFYMRPRT